MTMSGKIVLKWVARIVGAALVAVVYIQWKQITETYELENGVMGTYRPIALGLVYYLFWVFTRQIDDDSRGAEKPGVALYALFVCVGIAAGFFATQFTYVEAVDRSASVLTAKSIGFIAFMLAAVVVIEALKRLTRWQ